ncbi:MAG: UDP-N-acetylmuramoyl-L-alanine--D-glutamate ligase [Victivallaceae bacterium]|nr:UDP-N-acetylmuramoyl-L-alanine--D-glutamate ligase [Victivallaceae bacterium]
MFDPLVESAVGGIVPVFGTGASGMAAAKILSFIGATPLPMNDADGLSIPGKAPFAVVSPGMHPWKSRLMLEAKQRGLILVSEMEFGWRLLDIPVIAVTGTNGKTTTTELVVHMLRNQGEDARAVGNIGTPISVLALERLSGNRRSQVAVAETSSFQLELCSNFAPEEAALLNLASDHEDRYPGGFAEYVATKMSIFRNVPENRRVFGFSMSDRPHRFSFTDGVLLLGAQAFNTESSIFRHPHQVENLAAAAELVMLHTGKVPDIERAVSGFAYGHHRIEDCGTDGRGVKYVNDSKATNPHAVVAAVKSIGGGVVLLAGGLDKGMDFSALSEIIPLLRGAVVYGRAAATVASALHGVRVENCGNDFDLAVRTAAGMAEHGDCVLLSPACASMDMFKNYEERGNRFRELAEKIISGDEKC